MKGLCALSVFTAAMFAAPASAEEVKSYPCYNAHNKQGQAVVACGHYISGGAKVQADFTFSHASQPPEGQAWLRSVDTKLFICEVIRQGSKNGSVKGCHHL